MSRLLIRADATASIGSGHVMRCLALAQQWQANEGSVTLLSYTDNDGLRARVKQLGIEFVGLAEQHPHPLDLQSTKSLLAEKSVSHVVLDGYHFDPVYQQTIFQSGCRTLVIDDWAHQPRYSANVLLIRISGPINSPTIASPAWLCCWVRPMHFYVLSSCRGVDCCAKFQRSPGTF